MKKITFILILFSLSNISGIHAQTAAAIDAYINGQMNTNHIPGLSAIIIKNGTPVWGKAYGYANINQNIPVSLSTSFMVASTSKAVTAVALMNEYENGSFKLDDNINKYLPFTVKIP